MLNINEKTLDAIKYLCVTSIVVATIISGRKLVIDFNGRSLSLN